MKQQLDMIFTKAPTRQRAGKYIGLVNGRGVYPQTIGQHFTEGQVKYIRQKLHQHGLHTVVSEFVDLEPVQYIK